MCMVTTASYTQPEFRHAMETLDDEVFYAVYRWIMENEVEFDKMGVEMLGMTNCAVYRDRDRNRRGTHQVLPAHLRRRN